MFVPISTCYRILDDLYYNFIDSSACLRAGAFVISFLPRSGVKETAAG